MFEMLNKKDSNDEIAYTKKTCDQFCIRDLLEIFQGPVPFESSIMIATTNKYDEIKEL